MEDVSPRLVDPAQSRGSLWVVCSVRWDYTELRRPELSKVGTRDIFSSASFSADSAVDSGLFCSKFGVGLEKAQSLLEAKVGGISQYLYFLFRFIVYNGRFLVDF